jgi:hypothetical protein
MKQFFLIAFTSILIFSCKKDDNKQEGLVGTKVDFHEGKTWGSVKLTNDGAPEQLILTLDSNVLKSVPGPGQPNHHEDEVLIPLPSKALETTPFKFIMLNWNPSGHEPAGIYDLPHFDMHFYMNSPTEVASFVDASKLETNPGPDYLPAMHMGGAAVPGMGKHWIDLNSPELQGNTFMQTFIYGSYDGKVVFYEPMITLDFLKITNSFQRPLPQPAKFSKPGYYPTVLQVTKQNGQVNIILSGFVSRQAS